jgi:hypothetical protein
MPQDQINSQTLAYTIVSILFALSMISERLANMYKLYWPDMRNKRPTTEGEKFRERKIMWTALVCGWIVAFIGGADFFTLIHNGTLVNIFTNKFWSVEDSLPQTIFGFFLSGIFISLGSKFWHDMLDIVLQFSNLKKYQANTASATADSAQADALTSKVNLLEPQLRGMPGYRGYDFSSGPGVVNVKFDSQSPPSANQQASITNVLGAGNFNLVSTNMQTS